MFIIKHIINYVPWQAWALSKGPPKALGNCKAFTMANM